MNTTAIATLYRLDRSTVIRRLQRVRREVLDATRLRLRDRTGLSPSEVESVLGLVRSQVDVTLTGVLEAKP
jgi:RNA polymerase sigma-70 factor (ECF subfamily)